VTGFVYLHGFASSPRSTKAVFFSEQLTRLGAPVDVPDLEEGDLGHTDSATAVTGYID
jgi:hypothetical protein